MPARESRRAMKVVKVDEASGKEKPIGTISLGPDNQLTLIDAAAGQRKSLSGIVKDMNKRDRIHVEVAPPEGSPKFANASRIVERNDAEFLEAMKEHLRKYYGIELK